MGETNYKSALKDILWLHEPEAILIGWRGSIAHGTYEPQNNPNSIDDKDILSVVIPDINNYFGLFDWGSRGVKEVFRDEWDCVGYELKKFVSLLCKGNPNVLGMLWLAREDYLLLTDIGKLLIENRKLFATRQAYHSFSGYAHGQLHRMTNYGNNHASTELSYIAGIFDGEGHITITTVEPAKPTWSPLYLLEVGITNTDHDLIQHLLDQYGGYAGRTGIRDGHRLDAYRWRVSGPSGANFLKMVLPFLHIKKRQSEIGIAFQHSIRSQGKRLTEADLKLREEFRISLVECRRNKQVEIPGELPNLDDAYEDAYMGEKRRTLIRKFGYDTKNAAHLIRLLRMGIEFMTEGELHVKRQDATQLLEIKHGEWSLEKVKSEADRLFALAEESYIRSTLPIDIDKEKVNKVLTDILMMRFNLKGV